MHPRALDPSGAQIEVLLDAMPLVGVQTAAGQGVEGGAKCHGDVGDHEADMVSG